MATTKGAGKKPAGRTAKAKSTAMGMNKKAAGRGKPAGRARGATGGS